MASGAQSRFGIWTALRKSQATKPSMPSLSFISWQRKIRTAGQSLMSAGRWILERRLAEHNGGAVDQNFTRR